MVGAGGVSRRPVRRQAETGDEAGRKGRATRRRSEAEAAQDTSRTGPVTFVNESVGELRKVVWPTAEQMRTYFVVVLVFVVFMIAVVSLLDLLFGWALLQVFR
nr:preprotein translocase subunit SecE [Auraticoccus cholistanensis]